MAKVSRIILPSPLYAVLYKTLYGKDSEEKTGSTRLELSGPFKTEDAAIKDANRTKKLHHRPFWQVIEVSVVEVTGVYPVFKMKKIRWSWSGK